MISPFNVTQRYFVYFKNEINRIYNEKSIKVEDSVTWWMRTLYFTCLTSVEISIDNKLKFGLFNIFPNWQAYPNGPVNVESYQTFPAKLEGDYHSDDESCLSIILDKITDSIYNLLKNPVYLSIASNKDDLINLSRDLYLWKEAYVTEKKKLWVLSNLQMEIEFLNFNFITDVLKTNKNINSKENEDLFMKYIRNSEYRQKMREKKLEILGINGSF